MSIRQFWNADKFISLSAFLISMATFVVLIYQTQLWQEQNQLAHKQQYASVLPYLELGYNVPNTRGFALVLGNHGIGPAFIKAIRVHYKGKTFEGDPADFIVHALWPQGDTLRYYTYERINPGRVLPAGQETVLLEVRNNPEGASKLNELFGKEVAKVEVVYASVYEEVWQVKGTGRAPVKLTTK